LVSVLNIVLIIALVLLVIRYIRRRMKSLMNLMENVKKGDLSVHVPEEASDEFSYLFESFNRMLAQIDKQFGEIYRLKLLQKEAKLKLMQAQINPHFIYNIFNNISWMYELKKYERLGELTGAAATFFRKSLNDGKALISIQDEREKLSSYMLVQRVRFGERLDYHIDIDPQLLDVKILNHLLQPVLENAVSHGIEPKSRPGCIIIKGTLEKDTVLFAIKDNGAGMDGEKLACIRNMLASHNTRNSDYFALDNVNQRIKIFYGEDYGISIDSVIDEGTSVVLRLPMEARKNIALDDEQE
jgi:sensor histidine kinase YesM